ncbi:hypothetical protein A2U01_0016150, partial [Trifolium medium]|nr:hypothetical protein [Trifolium medium]
MNYMIQAKLYSKIAELTALAATLAHSADSAVAYAAEAVSLNLHALRCKSTSTGHFLGTQVINVVEL